MTIWFTSDTHFYHKNIIRYCNRPFESVEEMNAGLISNWNSLVKKDDEIWHLGDFAFCNVTKAIEILEQLNGKKHLVAGNHDYSLLKKDGFRMMWESIHNYKMLRCHMNYENDEGEIVQYHQPIALMHFPILSWDEMSHGSWMLHGHCHGSLPDSQALRLDVGVDCNPYYGPVSLEAIRDKLTLRTVVPVDHHGDREKFPTAKGGQR